MAVRPRRRAEGRRDRHRRDPTPQVSAPDPRRGLRHGRGRIVGLRRPRHHRGVDDRRSSGERRATATAGPRKPVTIPTTEPPPKAPPPQTVTLSPLPQTVTMVPPTEAPPPGIVRSTAAACRGAGPLLPVRLLPPPRPPRRLPKSAIGPSGQPPGRRRVHRRRPPDRRLP